MDALNPADPAPLSPPAAPPIDLGAILQEIPPALDLLAHFLMSICAPKTIAYRDSAAWLAGRGK